MSKICRNLVACLLASSWTGVFSSPVDHSIRTDDAAIGSLPPNLKLRILPLGDSITYGIGSTRLNGYRADLYKQLTAAGAIVDFVGSQKSGNFEKPSNEGSPGALISQISAKTDKALELKPNVVCLMAGTNDHIFGSTVGQDPKTATARIEALISKIVDKAPDAVLLVASLLPLNLTGTFARLEKSSLQPDVFNSRLPAIATAQRAKGKKVIAVDMSAVVKGDLADGIHPNDVGYSKMATAWFKAIEDAASKDWIKNPAI